MQELLADRGRGVVPQDLLKSVQEIYEASEKKLEEMKSDRGLAKEREEYLPFLKFTEVEAKRLQFPDAVGVSFKLENTGKKRLAEVRVTFRFKNSMNQVLLEDEFSPVDFNGHDAMAVELLEAGQVFQLKTGSFRAGGGSPEDLARAKPYLLVKGVPDEWKPEFFEAKVTYVDFLGVAREPEGTSRAK